MKYMCHLLEEHGYWEGWHTYIFSNNIHYILVIRRVYIFCSTSQFHSIGAQSRVQVNIYYPCPMLICHELFHWPSWIWMGSCGIFSCHVEMFLLIDSVVDVAIGNMDTSYPDWNLNWRCHWIALWWYWTVYSSSEQLDPRWEPWLSQLLTGTYGFLWFCGSRNIALHCPLIGLR